jgi:hypothetical protein
MDYKDAKERLLAAHTLLLEPSGSFEKFSAVKNLVRGLDPQLDSVLEHAEKELERLEQILGRHFVLLGIENLPENTEGQKKRKNAILFFWKTWNNLRAEVDRVQLELNDHASSSNPSGRNWWRVFNVLKAPLGILAVALVLVGLSAYSSVEITIRNTGCPTMVPTSSFPNFIPGISMPNNPIASGESATASIPGVPITIEDTGGGTLAISSLILHMNFKLGTLKSVTFDGMELLKHKTDINLSKQKTHMLIFTCK